jgi:hypothetical protein
MFAANSNKYGMSDLLKPPMPYDKRIAAYRKIMLTTSISEGLAMTTSNSSSIIGLCVAAIAAMLIAAPEGRAQSEGTIPPPLSYPRAQYFMKNPEAWSQFLAGLPQGPTAESKAAGRTVPPKSGGTWTAVTTAPAPLANPLLLTDGTVIASRVDAPQWFKLTPDINGSYSNGTWSRIATLPVIDGTQYAPLYHSSAVLPDGRVIIMGGEYNGGNNPVWTNMGAIYDPVANAWTSVSPPPGWSYFTNGTGVIGDSESVVLADGTFMQAACCLLPDGNALLDAASLTWSNTGAPRLGNFYQDEQGYNLLPDGNVLTIDIWTDFDFNTFESSGNPTNAEQYEPKLGLWVRAGNTPVSLVDPYECGNFEIGPAVMRPDGSLVAFGGNTGCKEAASQVNPTAIYATGAGTWSAGPNVPAVCGKDGTRNCDLADAPAALLPNGNILFAASAGYGDSPTHFFEYTKNDAIDQVADTQFYSTTSGAYYYNFVVLPNGQILSTDFSKIAEVYTPTGAPRAAWAPAITSCPTAVNPGGYYKISGTQFNGLSQGADYGDDVQAATNYPLVRITNSTTGHVFYARTANHSTMSIAPGTSGSTTFTVPGTIETGPSVLEVIANGIASKGVAITVD